jgi:RNA polymerase sigma factor (sigma-70 family)
MNAEAKFRGLFQQAYPVLHRYASNRGLRSADADDLVARTLEVAWRRLVDIPTDDPLPWLYAVARNLWRNQTRAAGRREALLVRLAPPDPQEGPGENGDLDVDSVRLALAKLDDDDRELLLLVAWDGLSPAKASVVLGCSAVAARTRLHRARNRLADRLGIDPRMQRKHLRGQIPDVTDNQIPATEASDV